MLTAPRGLSEEMLVGALADGWNVTVADCVYQPVGFGSHHWLVTDPAGERRFATVDELDLRRHDPAEPLTGPLERLRTALAAAGRLRESGRGFVVAPVPARDGAPLVRLADRFALALYPYVDGRGFTWGEFSSPEHRCAVLDMLVAVHAAPGEVRAAARADDYAIPQREHLVAALRPADRDCGPDGAPDLAALGPYAVPATSALAAHAGPVQRLLDRYDALVAETPRHAGRAVLTHGEPHPGNTMLTADGWRLIDWDTALVALPERDLWSLDPGDGSILADYEQATGTAPLASMLELFRLRWDLADLAAYAGVFRTAHGDSENERAAWKYLLGHLGALEDPGRPAS